MPLDDKDRVVSCNFQNCKAVISRPDRLQCHLRLHTGERPFICTYDDCDKSYTSLSHLKRHESTHEVSSFRCTVEGCHTVLKTSATLKKHMGHHIKKLKTYKCSECDKQFNKHSWLRMHMYKHTGIKPFLCTEENCGKRFLTPSKLKLHTRIHKGYACTKADCKEIFPTWTAYVKHFKTAHPKVYNCSACGKGFFTSFNRRTHEAIHKEEQETFPCPVENCSRYYFRKNNLTSHIRSYHETRPFVCPEQNCYRTYKTEADLESHQGFHDPKRKKKKRKKSKNKITFAAWLAGIKKPEKKRKKSTESDIEIEVEVHRTVENLILNSEEVISCNKEKLILDTDNFSNGCQELNNKELISDAQEKCVEESTGTEKATLRKFSSAEAILHKFDSKISEICDLDGNKNTDTSSLELLKTIISCNGRDC